MSAQDPIIVKSEQTQLPDVPLTEEALREWIAKQEEDNPDDGAQG